MQIQLVDPDPGWADIARREANAIRKALCDHVLAVHHIGSTAIPNLKAKPIVDLLPVVADLDALDECRDVVEALGYEWCGEFGLAGRRYCRKDAPEPGRRLVQAHFYQDGSSEILRHLAFRDHLRRNAPLARAYEVVKLDCAAANPSDPKAYGICKSAWIDRVERQAMSGCS